MSTIPEVFFKTAEAYPLKTALLYKKEGFYVSVTYKGLALKVKSYASALKKRGIKKGDTVALLLKNGPKWVVADLAIQLLGGVVVPLHSTYTSVARDTILRHCQAKLFITEENFAEMENGKSEEDFPVLSASDICTIIYTSGTTADPKGVMLTHENLLSNVMAVNGAVPVKENDVFLSFLPLSHVFERTVGYYVPLLHGATIAYAESVKTLVKDAELVKPTILICVPRVFEKFHDAIWDAVNAGHPLKKRLFIWALKQGRGSLGFAIADFLVFRKIRKRFGGRLRLAVSGGASLNSHLAQFFLKVGILILEGYGLTETSPVISTNRENSFAFGTVGKVVSGVTITIDANKEILVKGQNVFKGYLSNIAEHLDNEGFFHTGDLGFLDKEGFLTITGRKKDMFVLSGGKNIWPEPIENILNNDKYITQSMVVGNNQKFVGALIVPDWEEVATGDARLIIQQRLNEKINSQLSDVEKIKKFIIVDREFSEANGELTPTLKLRRHIIAKKYEREIASLYE